MSSKTLLPTPAVIFVLAIGWVSASAQSQTVPATPQTLTAEKRAAIAELLEVTEAKKMAQSVFNSIVEAEEKETPQMIWQTVSSLKEIQDLTPAQQVELKNKLIDDSALRNKRIRELFSQKIDFATLIDQISYNVYDKYFTESEIRDLIAFYKSPTGKKSIAVMPNLFAESMSSTMTSLRPKMGEIISELMDEEVNRVTKELESLTNPKTKAPRRAKPE